VTDRAPTLAQWQRAFIASQRLPEAYPLAIESHLSATACLSAMGQLGASTPALLGIYGAQGSGKSTLAAYLAARLEALESMYVVVLSLDDFYLTKAERSVLAHDIHPLLCTRGVPGTHDIGMLNQVLTELLDFRAPVRVPRFDKLKDDRMASAQCDYITQAPDLVILEGWCVGVPAQSGTDLAEPCNTLEQMSDTNGVWRRYVNHQLAVHYQPVWQRFDQLWGLIAPSFSVVFDWRLEQERRLGERSEVPIMTPTEIAHFIQHYQRLTEHALGVVPNCAQLCWRLDHERTMSLINESDD
jgi:D-glycerate 3-kinase